MAVDKPTVNLSLAALEAEIGKPEPFILALNGSKRITFPDLYDIPVDEAEAFFKDLEDSKGGDLAMFEKWLSKADFAAYKAAKIPLRVHAALAKKVTDYYQQSMGDMGEGTASAS